MSITVEQLAAEFEPLAVKEMVQLPPAPPAPAPKPAAPKPAAAPAAKPAAAAAAPSVTGPAVADAATPAAAATPKPAAPANPKPEIPNPKPAAAAPTAPKPAAAAPAAMPPASPLTKPVQIWKFEDKGIHLEVLVDAAKVLDAAKLVDRHGFAIDAVTGMDWPKQNLLEIIYDFLHFQSGLRVAVRARIPRNDPKIATISKVFPGADWHERETHDFFGIEFVGHRDLSPLLLPEDATYHPLLKDFQA